MPHFTTTDSWQLYNALPQDVRVLADKNCKLLKASPNHPSLHFKSTGSLWSIRVVLHYRALARMRPEGLYWFWIGPHGDYDKLLQ